MSWFTSLTTIFSMELMIRRSRWAFPVGCLNQAVWLAYILAEQQWGLLPLNCVLWFQHIRGTVRWWRQTDTVCQTQAEV